MRTRVLAFFLVGIWLAVTISVPLAVLWSPMRSATTEGELAESFATGAGGWEGKDVDSVKLPSAEGWGSLKVEWKNGEDTTVSAPPLNPDRPLDAIVVEMLLGSLSPDAARPDFKPILFLKNKDGAWFQAVGDPLIAGEWISYRFDLSDSSVQLQPVHARSPWNGQARRECDIWGFQFSCASGKAATVYLDNVRFVYSAKAAEPRVFGFRPGPEHLKTYDLFEFSFNLDPDPLNPFDPDEADINAEFKTPSGGTLTIPAFYYRPYRRLMLGDEEVLQPDGTSCWMARYTPVEPGSYSYRIAGKLGGNRFSTGWFAFTAEKSHSHGFVRVSKEDPRYFVFDDGTWFYPIGHNFRSPTDARTAALLKIPTPPDRGTFHYDDVFPKMAAAGENCAEVWMASWFAEIEWVSRWKNYRGFGKYNLANAWKLDKVLDSATRNNILLHLVIDNHGKLSNWVDAEWKDSPYSTANGGFLDNPLEFWSDARARKAHKNKLRYIIARWGYSPDIMGWELVSELDLTGVSWNNHKLPEVRSWHQEMASFLDKIDPNKHLITTHYSGNYKTIDSLMARQPYIAYVVGDAYRSNGDIVSLVIESAYATLAYKKPYFVTEYGGTPWGNSVPELHADLHAGIWSSYMTPTSGTPFFWWFDLIDRRDWYSEFAALAAFHKGENRLGKKYVPLDGSRFKCTESGVAALGIGNDREGLAWAYSMDMLAGFVDAPKKVIPASRLTVRRIKDGAYDVEFWDTYAGKKIGSGTFQVVKNELLIDLPSFKGDIAIKYRKAAGNGAF